MFTWFNHLFDKSYNPTYGCELYAQSGCTHVDGFLCDFPNCSMLKEYRESNQGFSIKDDEQFHTDLKLLMQESKNNRSPIPYA